jgi:hypothetical protein
MKTALSAKISNSYHATSFAVVPDLKKTSSIFSSQVIETFPATFSSLLRVRCSIVVQCRISMELIRMDSWTIPEGHTGKSVSGVLKPLEKFREELVCLFLKE